MSGTSGFLILNFYSLILLITTCFIFFNKKRLHQFEDKIYSCFLIITILVSVSGLLFGMSLEWNVGLKLSILLNKLYLISLLIWVLELTYYIYSISYRNLNMNKFFFSMCASFSIIVAVLPVDITHTDSFSSASGLSVIFTYFIIGICIMFDIVLSALNCRKNNIKKYIPIISLIFLEAIVLVMMIINPTLNYLINPSLILVVYIMYFTIENPDMKMLEEVHKAKKISDSANEEKAMFLYNMTNDIRNITKEIESSTDNILSETDNKSINIEYINDNAREIKSSTAKFTTMTNEILDVSSIDSSNIKIYNDRYNIKLILRQLVQEYKKKAEDKNIEFRTDIVSTLPEYLYGDSVGVKKVLSTIFENSLKYTESGYIEFSVNTITKQDIARLIITIEDSGRGIKAEDIDKIFNKKEEDKDYTNLNNNLYNARKLITLMGGTIIPSSVYGKGTVIKLVLDQKIYEEDTTEKKYDKYLDKKKVLVVDDSEASIKLISKILDNSNIEIEGVSLGKECLDRIRNKEKYDLILIDEKMEPISGLELMSKLKDLKNFNIKTILMTRNNDYEYNIEYVKYGFDDYILKPLDKDKVLEKLSKYL